MAGAAGAASPAATVLAQVPAPGGVAGIVLVVVDGVGVARAEVRGGAVATDPQPATPA